MADTNGKPLLSDEVYKRLKAILTLGFPAAATLFATLSVLFGPWDVTAGVLGTMAAVATFLGVILAIAQGRYDASDAKFDGELKVAGVDPDTGNPDLQLLVTTDPNSLADKNVIKLKSIDARN